MKRFLDYKPTEEEIARMYQHREDYEAMLRKMEKYPDSDAEKYKIAELLFVRGEREESRKMLELIEDEEYRWDCLHTDYPKWCSWAKGMV